MPAGCGPVKWGAWSGLELPLLAMEHQYLITEDMPELVGQKEQIHAIDFEGEIYMRQERGGMLMGTYERNGKPWSKRTTPWDFGQNLLPDDLDRISDSLEVGFAHFPAIGRSGIRKVVNGPFTFTPDGNPLIGPVAGLKNFWVACGVMAGFSQGGGVGLALSNWMIEGDPGFDVWGMDVARYGDWTTMAYTNAKVRENYSRRFRIRFPNEELSAARPLRTTPVYDALKAEGAAFGDYVGLEYPLWFAPKGAEPAEAVTFRRSEAHAHVGDECRAVREAAGLIEISNYGKFEVTGAGAGAFLSGVMAGRIPSLGRMALAPMLNERGKLIGDFTLARLDADRFFVVGTLAAEAYYMRWFERHLPASGGVTVRPCASEWVGFSIAGPRSREILQGLVMEDLSTESFPFMSFAAMDVGMVRARVGRVSFTGDLGYEIWCRADDQRALYAALRQAGEPCGIKLVGSRALNAMRIEKGFGSWAREFRPIYGPEEGGSRPLPRHEARRLRRARGGEGRAGRRRGVAARELRGRSRRRRRDRRRTDLARRLGRRLGHVGRLRPFGRDLARARLRPQRTRGRRRRLRDRDHRRAPAGASPRRADLRSGRIAHAGVKRRRLRPSVARFGFRYGFGGIEAKGRP